MTPYTVGTTSTLICARVAVLLAQCPPTGRNYEDLQLSQAQKGSADSKEEDAAGTIDKPRTIWPRGWMLIEILGVETS